jgi:hypothetical protein
LNSGPDFPPGKRQKTHLYHIFQLIGIALLINWFWQTPLLIYSKTGIIRKRSCSKILEAASLA